VLILDAVAGVALPERADGRHQRVKVVQATHRHRDHLHQLSALLLDIRSEQRAQRRVELEQPGVEQCLRRLGAVTVAPQLGPELLNRRGVVSHPGSPCRPGSPYCATAPG